MRLAAPDGEPAHEVLAAGVDAIAVVCRDDIRALRYALLVEHRCPGIRLLVTLFDKTVASEVVRSVPNCTVISMTDAIVPTILGPCLSDEWITLCRTREDYSGVRQDSVTEPRAGLRVESVARSAVRTPLRDRLLAQFRAVEGTSRALLIGLLGLLGVLVSDTLLGMAVLDEPFPAALWNASRTLTTVGSGEDAAHGPPWYHLVAALTMLAALACTAIFGAGLVDRVTSHRFTGIVGTRTVPRRGHVIVVGLGQVGLRLCLELQRLGIRVVAVERDDRAPCLPLARSLGVPVVLGNGGDRFLLQKVSVSSARALVAVSSDPLQNIAVAVATRALAPDQRIVLRAGGDDDVIAESQSLFRIGRVCDVNKIGGSFIAATAIGLHPQTTFTVGQRLHALLDDGRLVTLPPPSTGEDVGGNADAERVLASRRDGSP